MGFHKKRCLVTFSIVTLALTFVGYHVTTVVRERKMLIQRRALEFEYRGLTESTEGIQGYKPDWKEVIGGEGRVFMYSAFLDHRLAVIPQVRVIVLAPLEGVGFVECRFWTALNQTTTVTGDLTIFSEHHDLPLATGAIDCPHPGYPHSTVTREDKLPSYPTGDDLPSRAVEGIGSQYTSFEAGENLIQPHGEEVPVVKADFIVRPGPVVRVAVSIIAGMSDNYSSSIPVEVLVNRRKRGELNVCIKQMHSNYDSAGQLVEFIELQRLLGADHFTFYNLSIGPDVDRVFQHYIEEGVADVMPFSSPGTSNEDNIQRVQLASLNDCLLRSVGRYPLVAITDVDEIIVPHKVDDNLMMVQELGHYSEYTVQNAWFYLFYDDDDDRDKGGQTNDGGNVNLPSPEGHAEQIFVTQRIARRVAELYPHTIRSKYLCRPEEVLVGGIHTAHKYIGGGSAVWVDAKTALSHHYRANCVEGDPSICLKQPSVVDRTAHRFRNPLINAVIRACRAIFPARSICLPPPDSIH